ncbi:MAG: hypothetical protein IPG69_04885 [Flavobacteriales bacterium]|nr:hypothetical protein [Flavobacteriales bacterium]
MDQGQGTIVCFPASGEYSVRLVVTTANGCTDSLSVPAQVIVHPQPVAGFFPDPPRTGILEPEIQFTDTSQGAVAWAYVFGDGDLSLDQHPTHLYPDHGTYLVE